LTIQIKAFESVSITHRRNYHAAFVGGKNFDRILFTVSFSLIFQRNGYYFCLVRNSRLSKPIFMQSIHISRKNDDALSNVHFYTQNLISKINLHAQIKFPRTRTALISLDETNKYIQKN